MKSPMLKRLASGYRGIAMMVLNTLILLILLELVAGAILSQRGTTLELEIEAFKEKQLELVLLSGDKTGRKPIGTNTCRLSISGITNPILCGGHVQHEGELITVNEE